MKSSRDDDMLRVTRFEEAAGSYWLGFGSNDSDRFRQTVDDIKQLLAHERQWTPNEPGGKAWWIADSALPSLEWFAPDLMQVLKAYQRGAGTHRARTTYCLQRRSNVPADVRDAFASLHLAPTAPPELVAARRVLARLHHLDHGGKHLLMVHINRAADVAEQWLVDHAST